MAREVITHLVDDIDSDAAERTFLFGVDGIAYEIDLSTKHLDALEDFLTPYVAAAQKIGRITGKTATPPRRTAAARSADPEQNQAVREWARANGHTVADRGRIAASVVEAFNSAH